MADLHLIVGLGNPGSEYAATRHNAGFLVVGELARRWRVVWRDEGRFNVRVARGETAGRSVLLVQPLTWMNLSGEAVAAVMRYHRVPLERVMVVVDDADLPLGALRLRPGGSSGGHHGLESVGQHLGTREFARQRVGIGRRDSAQREITGHVLGRFGAEERPVLDKVLGSAGDQLECWLANGLQVAMARHNGPGQ
ncbi:MAG: aminoacyl-tRNA hydrolase [Limisphaerales bacterium]